jgi:catechol 2,3-dioxygenase-like lactoylglutathione lyase family enzyme
MSTHVEVRRLLHCNYNCHDVDNLERFYSQLFGLRQVMRSGGEGDGTPFGLYGTTASTASFLYDHRGGRYANSLELVQWHVPATYGSPYPHPWCNGIQSVAYSAADLDALAADAVSLGGSIVRRGDDWLVLNDPEGVNVEVLQADGPSEMRYLRIVTSDLDRSLAWWAGLGFTDDADDGGALSTVAGDMIWPAQDGRQITAERRIVATDDSTFGIVFTTWSGPQPPGPTYAVPYHAGLYRMAMAVDDVHTAHTALMKVGVPRVPPYTFQLPGTKLTDGLTILFIRDPDGILVELVDRPRVGRRPASQVAT